MPKQNKKNKHTGSPFSTLLDESLSDYLSDRVDHLSSVTKEHEDKIRKNEDTAEALRSLWHTLNNRVGLLREDQPGSELRELRSRISNLEHSRFQTRFFVVLAVVLYALYWLAKLVMAYNSCN